MSETRTGRCHCGDVKVTIKADDMFRFSCHCADCMKLVSGGRLLGLGVPEDSVTITGNTSIYSYPGGSGELLHLHFCPNCSTQIGAIPEAHKGTIIIRANVLDDIRTFKPGKHIHTDNALEWDIIE